MRWQVSLQLAVGLGALFGFGYLTVERFLGPPTERRVVETAEARAIVAAAEVSSAWERTRSGRRALIRALAASPALAASRTDLLSGALESAAAQMGGERAALVDAKRSVTASHGDAGEALADLEATADALGGAATVRLERMGDALFVVAAAPREAGGALVVASPFGREELTSWTRGLPPNVAVAVLDQERVLASTLPPRHAEAMGGGSRLAPEVNAGDTRYRTARRTFSDDAGTKLEVIGFAGIDTAAVGALVEQVRLLILFLGGLSFFICVLVVALAPRDDVRGLIEDFNQATSDIPVGETQRLSSSAAAPEPKVSTVEPVRSPLAPPPQPRAPTPAPEERPRLPEPAPLAPTPSLEQVTRPIARPRPESDTSFAPDVEHRFRGEAALGSDGAIPLPSSSSRDAPVPLPPSDPPLRAPSQPPLPQATQPLPPQVATTSSPFEQIAAAAMSKPPAPTPSPPPSPPPPLGAKDADMIAPKGVDLQELAARAAQQGATSSPGMPTDLPGLKPERPIAPPENLPGLRESHPGGRADPWQNPSAPPPPQPVTAGPVAYDEEHYRVVYNDFVASKARLGEVVDNITYEGFRSKLRSSEEALINQHGCRAVRFQVLVRDNTVSLRPQLVR